MWCAEIIVMLLGITIVLVAGEVDVDSVDEWIRGTDLCKSWSIQDSNGTCQCAQENPCVKCYNSYKATELKYRSCATYDNTKSTAHAGLCPFNHLHVHFGGQFATDIPVPNINLTSFMCGPLNRTGVLCSQCKEGLGPALLNYSYPCLKCSGYNWASYFAATLLPATVFLGVIVIFRIDAFSPSLSYFTLHCQLVSLVFHRFPNILYSTGHSYAQISGVIVITSYGIWNLDFLRVLLPPFCVSSEMDMRTVLALEYVVALYPLLCIIGLYVVIEMHARGYKALVVLWKPFHPVFYRFRKIFNIRGSVMNAFATFICLSYSKILATSFNLMFFGGIYNTTHGSGHHKGKFLFYNASIPFSDVGNAPYFVLAVTMLAVFCLLPLLALLLLHTRFCRCLRKFKLLLEVVKSCHKHYKDGSHGTSDLRPFSALPFMVRLLMLLTLSVGLGYDHADVAHFSIGFVASLSIAYSHPYKERKYNYLDSFWFSLLTFGLFGLLYMEYAGSDVLTNTIVVAGILLPLMYMSAVVVYLFVRWCVRARCVQHCFRSLLMSLWYCKPKGCDCQVEGQLDDQLPHDQLPHDQLPHDQLPHDQLPHDKLPHDQLPHRLLNPAEYEPLLQK